MKLSSFRIKERVNLKNLADKRYNNEKQQQNIEEPNSKNFDKKMSHLMQSFEHLLTSFAEVAHKNYFRQSKNSIKNPVKEIEYRDRLVVVDVPEIIDGKIQPKKLKAWVGEVCSESLSIAFHYFMEKKINEHQMKAFASESVLRNLSILADSYKLSPDEIKYIDETMKYNVLPYLKAKYPLTVENQVSKILKNLVKPMDNSELITNDYFYSSDIEFQYRENGRYDDVIMRFLNQLMKKIDQKSGENEESNYKKFDSFMTEIFSKSFDENWINENQGNSPIKSKDNIHKQRQKYKQMVKSYTHFLIGRKISLNTPNFTEQEIQSKNIQIKSPAILRILTKWCEELWQKFSNLKYFQSRTEGFLMFPTKNIGTLTPTSKDQLARAIRNQKQKIEKFLSQVEEINYQQQVDLLSNELSQEHEETYIENYERVSGMFACKNVKNVERFIIDYLNLLIHSLIVASQTTFDRWMVRYPNRWSSRYNLITFNVYDLFRCKYSSKEKEVNRIFNEIERISNQNPEKLKIIRIKDRLSQVTSDIMINARFNNSINCEIQIAVNSAKSDFMDCTNKINHYIYELERAQFGPILQICSVWKAYEKRSQIFDKLIERKQPQRKVVKDHEKCLQSPQKIEMVATFNPFICSVCSKHHYRNNYLTNHLKCQNCSFWKCALCVKDEKYKRQDLDFFFKQNKYKKNFRFLTGNKMIPNKGGCFLINSPEMSLILFRKIIYNQHEYIVYQKNGQITILRQIKSQKQVMAFFDEFVVFQFPQSVAWQEFNVEGSNFSTNVKSTLIIPQEIEQCIRDKKQSISIMSQGSLSKTDLTKVFQDNLHKLHSLTHLQFVYTELKNIDFLFPDFTNLKIINFGSNSIKDISKIFIFQNLEKIDLSWNEIQQIPSSIGNLKKLEQLKLYSNKIKNIPETLTELQSLQFLNISQNSLQRLPQKMGQLKELKQLILNRNKLTQFPNFLENLTKLQVLNLNDNCISAISQDINMNVASLKSLYLQSNKLKQLPQKLSCLKSLKILDLAKNQFQQIPMVIKLINSLEKLDISKNKLLTLSKAVQGLTNLSELHLSENKIVKLDPCVFGLVRLTSLKLDSNQIEQIEDSFEKLTQLKHFTIDKNKLKKIPSSLKFCPLKVFKFQSNFLEQFELEVLPKDSLAVITLISSPNFKNIINFDSSPLKNHVQKIELSGNNLGHYPEFLFYSNQIESIKASSNKIKQIPNLFTEKMALNEILLRNNQLTQIPQSIGKLKKMQTLVLSSNMMTEISDSICQLQNMRLLNLYGNKIKVINKNIKNLKRLKVLNIGLNEIESIPDELAQLEALQQLILMRNKIQHIPLSICNNAKITLFDLKENLIKIVPQQIVQMTGLKMQQGLILNGNPIKEIGNMQFAELKMYDFNGVKSAMIKLNEASKIQNQPQNSSNMPQNQVKT